MLWIASKLLVDKRLLTLAKGKCAETVKHLMKDERSVKSVDAAIAYGLGEITSRELETAADAAYAAYADTADDASYSAYAAAAASGDAGATAAYSATYANAGNTAKNTNQKQTADICREVLTEAVLNREIE